MVYFENVYKKSYDREVFPWTVLHEIRVNAIEGPIFSDIPALKTYNASMV